MQLKLLTISLAALLSSSAAMPLGSAEVPRPIQLHLLLLTDIPHQYSNLARRSEQAAQGGLPFLPPLPFFGHPVNFGGAIQQCAPSGACQFVGGPGAVHPAAGGFLGFLPLPF